MEKALPSIPPKRYFTIGEVRELCGVKPYVLRYWEQEFTQLKPMKRRGNRRYYQHHEVLLVRRIRELLYDHGFTISGARNRLSDGMAAAAVPQADVDPGASPGPSPGPALAAAKASGLAVTSVAVPAQAEGDEVPAAGSIDTQRLRNELISIRDLLSV